jgi:hypothetical protein
MSIDIDAIVEKIWNDIKKNSTKSKHFALFTMGLPASGKSESIELVIEDIGLNRSDFIIIDPDEFMKYIPGYRNNNARSFNKDGVIISSRILKLINESTKNYNYIYFGTGRNFKSYQTMINKANKNDYTTILVNVEITLEKAKQRARKRSRRVNDNVINKINSNLRTQHTRKSKKTKKTMSMNNLEILSEIVDHTYIIDNNGERNNGKGPEIKLKE